MISGRAIIIHVVQEQGGGLNEAESLCKYAIKMCLRAAEVQTTQRPMQQQKNKAHLHATKFIILITRICCTSNSNYCLHRL